MLLKILSPYISSPLAQIVNESFHSGIFSEKLQHAKVVLILEQRCPLAVSNYNLYLSSLFLTKISETLMYKRLSDFLDVHQILYNLQLGLRVSLSTNHILISLTECIKNSLANKNFGYGTFIDLQKAFDTALLMQILFSIN